MATLTINGVQYDFPSVGSVSWGENISNWAAAVSSGMLQKSGGAFTLTANVNFGASFGLVSTHFSSRTANAASAGAIRLANADAIKFRNSTGNGDISLAPGSTNSFLSYAGVDLANISTAQTLTNKTIDGDDNTVQDLAL